MTTAKPKSNGAAPGFGPHPPTFTKPPPLSVFLERVDREFACEDPRFDDIKHPAIRRLASAVSSLPRPGVDPRVMNDKERAVLDAMGALSERSLAWLDGWEPHWRALAAAELSRRQWSAADRLLSAASRHPSGVAPPPMSADELCSALAFLCVLAAVKRGATLTLTGPRSVVNPAHEQIGATLESPSGDLCVNAEGDDLTTVLVELAKKYGTAP